MEKRNIDQLAAQVEQLTDDLADARNGLESAAEELRQSDAMRDQLVAALRSARNRCTAWNDQAGGGAIDAALKAAGIE